MAPEAPRRDPADTSDIFPDDFLRSLDENNGSRSYTAPDMGYRGEEDAPEGGEQPHSANFSANPGYFESASGMWGKMSEGARHIASKAYEGMYKVPGVNRVAAKLEISYNQFWIDRHEGKAVKSKEEMDKIDIKVRALDSAEERVRASVDRLREMGVPGVERLESKVRDIEDKKSKLFNNKDNQQTKFEQRDNKKKTYTNKRDEIADRLITHYEEKLQPLENKLEVLGSQRDRVNMFITVMEVQHKRCEAEFEEIKNEKEAIQAAMISAGMSEKTIRETVSIFDEQIAEGKTRLREEKAELAKRKEEINQKIAKVDKKANPKRDKREEFVRIKARRPITINTAPRMRGEVFDETEETSAHPRAEAPTGARGTRTPGPGNFEERSHGFTRPEGRERDGAPLGDFISGLNRMMRQEAWDAVDRIDAEDFFSETGLTSEMRVSIEDAVSIVEAYCKYKKIELPEDWNQE
jgi:hypothetical protein